MSNFTYFKQDLNLLPYFEACQHAKSTHIGKLYIYIYIIFLLVLSHEKKESSAGNAGNCIFYFSAISMCVENNQMTLPSFASTLEDLRCEGFGLTHQTAEILRLE